MNTTFGIALTGLLLEHEWPVDITRVIQQVHDALVSNDAECISRASRADTYAADYAADANYAADAAAPAYAAHAAAAYITYYASHAAYYANNATDYAARALPGEATRIHTLHTLLAQ